MIVVLSTERIEPEHRIDVDIHQRIAIQYSRFLGRAKLPQTGTSGKSVCLFPLIVFQYDGILPLPLAPIYQELNLKRLLHDACGAVRGRERGGQDSNLR